MARASEERMSQIVGGLVREQVAEFQDLRIYLVGLVEAMFEMSSHFDGRVATAETQITARQEQVTSDIQARDEYLRQFLDSSAVSQRAVRPSHQAARREDPDL